MFTPKLNAIVYCHWMILFELLHIQTAYQRQVALYFAVIVAFMLHSYCLSHVIDRIHHELIIISTAVLHGTRILHSWLHSHVATVCFRLGFWIMCFSQELSLMKAHMISWQFCFIGRTKHVLEVSHVKKLDHFK